MKENERSPKHWLYGIAIVSILFGILMSTFVIRKSGVALYPDLIANAYGEEQHHLKVPGARDVKLTRTGAYGIYHERSLVSDTSDPQGPMPPDIDCSLTSKSTGKQIEAIPDYIEANRYWSKEQDRYGILIMSVTVPQPDTYTFDCHYQDGSTEPEILVALGPNYVWEFFRVSGKITASLLIGLTTLCGSVLIGLAIIIVVATRSLQRKKTAG